MHRLTLVFVAALVATTSVALAQTTTTERLRVTTEAPPPVIDPVCPNTYRIDTDRWTIEQRVHDIKSSAEADAFQKVLLDKSVALAAAYDACAAGYVDPSQKQSYYHARVRAGSAHLAIANSLISLRRTTEAQTALLAGKTLLDEVQRADAADITASDLKMARVNGAIFDAELRGIAERGTSYSPYGMFRALASPQPSMGSARTPPPILPGAAPTPDPVCPDVPMLPYRYPVPTTGRGGTREEAMADARAQAADYMKTLFLAMARAWDDCASQYSSEDQLRKWAHARERSISTRVAAATAALSGHDSASAHSILDLARSQLADLLRLNDGAIDPVDRRAGERLLPGIDRDLKGIAEQGDAYTRPLPTPTPSPLPS
jgi:hypothetical protein